MKLELTVPTMVCDGCAETITKAIQIVDAAATVEADPQTKQVVVNTSSAEAAVKAAVEQAGHEVA